MTESKNHPPLVWLDLEMTGLDPDSERIIEIATVVTGADLEGIKEGPNLVIRQPQEYIDGMDEWNLNQHSNSGLLDSLKATQISVAEAEKQTLDFLTNHVQKRKSPLCGNSISHDRGFLVRYMPELANFFHYRNVDVTSIKELVRRWYPDGPKLPRKSESHMALTDVRESLNELIFYRREYFTSNCLTVSKVLPVQGKLHE